MSDKGGKGGIRSDTNDALIEFGKKMITDSVSIINEYIKMMIPLTTGLIATYFALLEFLGVKDIINLSKSSAASSVEPTFFMLGSLIAFILTLFPVISTIDLGIYDKIRKVRKLLIIYRYVGAGIGMSLFLYGLYLMIRVVESILKNS